MENSDTGVVMLDVRSEREATTNPIQKAKVMPLSQLRNQVSKLSDEFVYLLQDDSRGEAAAYILSEAGLKTCIVRHKEAAN